MKMSVHKLGYKRNKRIEIRVSKEEYLVIEEKARRYNLNISEYLRREGMKD